MAHVLNRCEKSLAGWERRNDLNGSTDLCSRHPGRDHEGIGGGQRSREQDHGHLHRCEGGAQTWATEHRNPWNFYGGVLK